MIAPGTILAGKFQVERTLGQGGMGVVVAAHHLVLGQRVAIKFLLPEAMAHAESVERFLREARAAVRLRSEHVGRVIDVGRFDDGAPYIVMEYLEGSDLAATLQRTGPLPAAQSVDFILQACEAIAEAHAIGIVHRDLKPGNLFLTRGADGAPLVKVLDFGISKAASADDFSLTRTNAVMGSPGYMSPEQLRSSRDVDARSDIWSLGVILFELTTGRQPFVATTITELALKVAMDPTPPLYGPHLPPGFDRAVLRCLEKNPARRYGSVAELAAALAPFGGPAAHDAAARIARVMHVSQPMHAPAALTAVSAPTTLSGATGQTHPGGRGRGRWPVIAAVAVAVVGGAVIAALALGDGDAPVQAASPMAAPGAAAPAEARPDPAPVVAPDATTPEVAPAPAPEVAPPPAPAPEAKPATPAPEVAPAPAPRKPARPRPKRDDDLGINRY